MKNHDTTSTVRLIVSTVFVVGSMTAGTAILATVPAMADAVPAPAPSPTPSLSPTSFPPPTTIDNTPWD